MVYISTHAYPASVNDMSVSTLQIDPREGSVRLPNGLMVEPHLTQNAFLNGPWSETAESYDRGTLPFIHYDLPGGRIMERDLRVSMCFYDRLLVTAQLAANLYPPQATGWSHYSLEVEAATKTFHDALLTDLLGEPTSIFDPPARAIPVGQRVLHRSLNWRFAWGAIWSSHDIKGGGTSIVIRYGNRLEETNQAYRSRQKPHQANPDPE